MLLRYIKLFAVPGLLMGLMVVAADCASAPKALETEADFTGFITEIHPIGKGGTLGQILVESHADKLVDKYMVTIKDETQIFEQAGEERRQAAFEVLETRQRVQIWFSGPILESYPMQGTAQQVVIIKNGK